MLKFYFNPISTNARRVWVALLEKQIAFEPVQMKLDGDHFDAELGVTAHGDSVTRAVLFSKLQQFPTSGQAKL